MFLPSEDGNSEGEMNGSGQGRPLQDGGAEGLDLAGIGVGHRSLQDQLRVDGSDQLTLLPHRNPGKQEQYHGQGLCFKQQPLAEMPSGAP